MSSIEKLKERFLNVPNDFSIYELEKLLSYYGYKRNNKDKTSGSRIIFYRDGCPRIHVHVPHNHLVNQTSLKEIKSILIRGGII